MKTKIQWTDAVWNPVTGCTKVSPGCAHCYAETVAGRFWATQYPLVDRETVKKGGILSDIDVGPRKFTDVRCHPDRLEEPLKWRKPRRVFVNSMSDLFHEDVPAGFIDRVFAVMALAPQHTFQLLTKRADRMRDYVNGLGGRLGELWDLTNQPTWVELPAGRSFPRYPENWPLPNVWAGVSVENQRFADERIPLLLQTPAAIRFVSYEPALGPVDFVLRLRHDYYQDALRGFTDNGTWSGSRSVAPKLDWVIVGGESGTKARPCDVAWIRSVLQQCRAAGVACFTKQLGAFVISSDGDDWIGHRGEMVATGNGLEIRWRILYRDRKGGDPAEWPEDLRVREYPEVSA